jgi:hypothetical protein
MLEYVFIIFVVLVFLFVQFLLLGKITKFFNRKGIGIRESGTASAWGILLLNTKKKKGFFGQLLIFLFEILINLIWYAVNLSLLLILLYYFSKIYNLLI